MPWFIYQMNEFLILEVKDCSVLDGTSFALGSPLALNLKYSLNVWIYFKGADQRVELPFFPVDESHLHMPE